MLSLVDIIKSRKTRIGFFFFYFLANTMFSVYGQQYETTRYADDNGLPSRIVRDVYQDSKGFLWVAGNNGLFKFDGQKFSPFYSSLKDTTGLRSNKITGITETHDGKLWIGTPKGLHVLDNGVISYFKIKKNVTEEQNYITTIKEDTNKNLWVGTYGGLFVVPKDRNQVFYISNSEIGSIPENLINGLYIDKKKHLWVTTNDGIFISSNNENYVFNKIIINYENRLTEDNTDLFKINEYNDDLLLIDSNNGLLKGELENESTIKISPFLDEDGNRISKDYIYDSTIDHEKNIWIATWKNKFKKYKIEENNLKEQDVTTANGLINMSGNCISVLEDVQHNIWVTNTNGLYKLTALENKIFTFPPKHIPNCLPKSISVYDIIEDNNNNLWVATPTDLYRFNKNDIINGICPSNFFHLSNTSTYFSRNIFIDSQNRLWLSSQRGVSIAQLDEYSNPGEFILYTKNDGLPHNWSYEVLEENKDNFWITNYSGLVKLTLENGNLNTPIFKTYLNDRKNSNSLVNSYTLAINEDKNGDKWIGTFNGLSKLIAEEETGYFINYLNVHGDFNSLSNNSIKRIFKDKSGRLWIGTQTGLNLYDYNNDVFLQFGRADGLPSEYILGIEEDSKGFLWVATTNGVIKAIYDDSNQKFVSILHYTNREGLADNITNKNAIYIDKKDNVFIGSSKGISVLSNIQTSKKENPYHLELTSIENIKKNDVDFSKIEGVNTKENIELSHIESSLKINYAALDFTQPKFNQYRHKLLPISDNWVNTGNKSELTYYNLAPGDYELILDGVNNQGVWSKQPIHLKIVINPPILKSNLALFIYALIFLALLRLWYLFRIRRRMRELQQQVKLEHALVNEREQLRQENTADFHDELGSKVTKISLFLTLAERSLNDKKDPTEWLIKIRSNIKDLSGGFRDLLWVIDPKKDSLSDVFLRLKDYGEDIFNNGQKQFRAIGNPMDKSNLRLDPQTKKQVVMIFKEAMNNCSKYSECENVELNISSNESYSSIELTDDGKGFNIEKKSKGRGLKNMMVRAKKMNANITIRSNNNGTSILLDRIPHMSDNFNTEDV